MKKTRSRPNALAPPPSRSCSPAAVQPPSASGDDVSTVEPVGMRTRSKSSQRLPPPPTPHKEVCWAIQLADTGEQDNKERQVVAAKMRTRTENKERQVVAAKMRTRTQPSRKGKRAASECSNALVMIPPENLDRESQSCMQPTHTELHGTRGQRCSNKSKVQKEAQRRSKRQEPSGRENLCRALVPAPVGKSMRRKSRPLREWLGERFVYSDFLSGAIGIKSYSRGEDGKVALRVESFLPTEYSDRVARLGMY
ncbi:uncharacterized protein LOC123404736 [Hordeum vulgare subsp. vulgare]|uniref:uncharacterized protein LOC123404736 n=1 Tax=Hordeum vulgare subsp. vulgare TaxID=112509 RepID=UPI001D1A4AF3|nr:uncharacterized protein LOC123404736 [Hordeum vulgare subsp. vulgare]